MKKFLVLLLTLSLMLTVFAACNKKADSTEAAKETGTAKETEATAAPTESGSEEPEATKAEIKEQKINYNINGTWKATINLSDFTTPALEGTVDLFIDFNEKEFTLRVEEGLGEKIVNATLAYLTKEAEALGTTPEEYLKSAGLTAETLKSTILEEFEANEAFSNVTGTWIYDTENKIHFGDTVFPCSPKSATELMITLFEGKGSVSFVKQ